MSALRRSLTGAERATLAGLKKPAVVDPLDDVSGERAAELASIRVQARDAFRPRTIDPLPSVTDWDAIEGRAAAADASKGALAAATGRADGSAVRAFRSRKGRTYPGHKPEVHGTPERAATAVQVGTLPAPRSLADALSPAGRFDPVTVRVALARLEAATRAHGFHAGAVGCDCGAWGPFRCVCGGRAAARSESLECDWCGAPRGAVCHRRGHEPRRDDGMPWEGYRAAAPHPLKDDAGREVAPLVLVASKAARLRAGILARVIDAHGMKAAGLVIRAARLDEVRADRSDARAGRADAAREARALADAARVLRTPVPRNGARVERTPARA